MPKIIIDTDLTQKGTTISIDGKTIKNLVSIYFNLDRQCCPCNPGMIDAPAPEPKFVGSCAYTIETEDVDGTEKRISTHYENDGETESVVEDTKTMDDARKAVIKDLTQQMLGKK
jgi:hypothetical protein